MASRKAPAPALTFTGRRPGLYTGGAITAMPPAADLYILAVDHGVERCTVALVSLAGEVLGHETEHTPPPPAARGAEQPPDRWWEALLDAAERLLLRGLAPAHKILAVCCSGAADSTVLVDAQGAAVLNALTGNDSRGAPHLARQLRGPLNWHGTSIVDLLRLWPRAGGPPPRSGRDHPAHLLYARKERAAELQRADKALASKDFLNLRLCDRLAASPDTAALFWAADTSDVDHVRYCPRLIRKLGIPPDWLPPLQPSGTILGELRLEVASRLGLPRLPVVVGASELNTSCLGAGATADLAPHLHLGAAAVVTCHAPTRRMDRRGVVLSLPSLLPGRYLEVVRAGAAGDCRRFLVDNLLYHRNALQRERPPAEIHAQLDEVLRGVPAGSGRLLFTPWLDGARAPAEDAALHGGLHNLSLQSTTSHVIRAVHEGVAFNCRWALRHLELHLRQDLGPLAVSGGVAASGAWCQLLADVLDRELRVLQPPGLAKARGAALLAGLALQQLTLEEVAALAPRTEVFLPRPEVRQLYDELFIEYSQIARREQGMHRRLNRP